MSEGEEVLKYRGWDCVQVQVISVMMSVNVTESMGVSCCSLRWPLHSGRCRVPVLT